MSRKYSGVSHKRASLTARKLLRQRAFVSSAGRTTSEKKKLGNTMTKYGPKHNLDAAPRARLPSHGPRKRSTPSMPRLNLPPPVDEDA